MQIRRPIAALFTALALFGGATTTAACQAAGDGQSDGTTDSGNPDSGNEETVPDNSEQEPSTSDEPQEPAG
jgi:hypothetical protein